MMSANQSVFEKTWRDEGIFTEMTNEEMGVDYSELHEDTRHFALPLNGNAYLKWSHDTMVIKLLMKIFDPPHGKNGLWAYLKFHIG